jgi:hypothetical protein
MLSIFDLYNIIKESDIGHKGLLYSERFSLWREYIVNLEWFEWLIGKNISHYRGRIFLRLNGNLHSSFFQMHARCGLGGLMFSIYILMIMLKRKKSYRVKMFSVLLFAILIRGFFDIIFFFTPNDFVVMALLFSLVVEKNSKYKFNILKYDTERHNKHERQL